MGNILFQQVQGVKWTFIWVVALCVFLYMCVCVQVLGSLMFYHLLILKLTGMISVVSLAKKYLVY